MPAHRSLLPALVAAAVWAVALPAAAVPGDGPAHRPVPHRAQRTIAAAPATAGAVSAAGPATGELEADPLAVTIESLNPSVIPVSGKVTITGTVTNTTDETWVGINVYPLTSSALPMTSIAELDAAARTDVDLVVGERIIEVSDRIEELAPGEVAPYALRVPRRYLGRTEGVHWLGVHTLAQNAEGRDGIADGKARTFLPLVGKQRRALPTALVLQLRRRIQYAFDGRIDRAELWAADLAPGGRLREVVELGAAAGDRPMTWLLDPAVISTVNALVAGNQSRMPPVVASPRAVEPSTPEESPTNAPSEGLVDPADPALVAETAIQGQAWLNRLPAALGSKQLLALPYGDLDASAASHLQPTALVDAHTASTTAMAALGLQGTPAIGSPNGFLNPVAIGSADAATTVLGSTSSVAIDAPAVVEVRGRPVVLASATAVQGGPGPDDPLATVAVRQRILSEAAVRLLSPGRQPLVVTLPAKWSPGDVNGFFSGLDVGWVDLRTIADLPDRAAQPVAAEDYLYPTFQQDLELEPANFAASDNLNTAGRTLQQVLTANPTVGAAVTHEAQSLASYWQRPRPIEARAAASRSEAWIEDILGRVTVTGPPSVTLSSATGQFPATLTNGLDEPVLVRVDAVASSGLTVTGTDSIALEPGESTRLRLSARTEEVGTHSVELVVAAADGTPLGAATELPIRSNQVSRIIWIVIIAGGGLLFGAIALRLVRRVMRTRGQTPA